MQTCVTRQSILHARYHPQYYFWANDAAFHAQQIINESMFTSSDVIACIKDILSLLLLLSILFVHTANPCQHYYYYYYRYIIMLYRMLQVFFCVCKVSAFFVQLVGWTKKRQTFPIRMIWLGAEKWLQTPDLYVTFMIEFYFFPRFYFLRQFFLLLLFRNSISAQYWTICTWIVAKTTQRTHTCHHVIHVTRETRCEEI